ncbi:hypothetical protein [Prescottella equi]|uniref:hypothetical protein n=1 Tax=Rhodococcus hoagii TaxID=43767 RepID=UPI0019EB1E68|nr:hypothetical protein [Prescottella equi]MBM4597646.1 hypothetical protein [Prescottella equi]NKS29512.1 hypothetical protein [Prescottella equi]
MGRTNTWPVLDRGTRLWWRTVGRRIDLEGDHAWLAAPVSGRGAVADRWLPAEAERIGGRIDRDPDPWSGLLPSLDALAGPGFDPAAVHPALRDFYEHTSAWRMDAWTKWSRGFAGPGAVIESLYGKRLQQLALPVDALAVAHGVDSEIVRIVGPDGTHAGSAWLRTLRKTGDYMFSGYYRVGRLPGHDQPSVHVSFPLEQGNVQVYLRPSNGPGGAMTLSSPPGPFGDDGAYVMVIDDGRTYAARVPVHEEFRLYVDDEGIARTDHVLKLWGATAVRLHYRLVPVPDAHSISAAARAAAEID